MDTKLKNTNSNDIEIKETKKINLYSLKSKIILVILICILAFISYNSYIFIVDKEIIYKGYDIENNFGQYCYNIIEARLNLKNEDHIREVYQKKYNVDSNYKPKKTETYTQEQTSIVEDISITEDVIEESHIY